MKSKYEDSIVIIHYSEKCRQVVRPDWRCFNGAFNKLVQHITNGSYWYYEIR